MNLYSQITSNKRKTWVFLSGFVSFIVVFAFVIALAIGFDSTYAVVIAFGFAVCSVLVSYYYSDKMVLAISQAKEIKKEDNPDLYRIVENIAIGAGLPTPKIYEINDTAPNAFATGRDPNHAVVAVTSGLVQKLEKVELEGVIAHEISHIGNYDILIMTIVAILAGSVVLISDFFLRIAFRSRSRSNSRSSGQAQAIIFLIAIILAIIAPIIAQVIKLAISRKREFLADATGVMITRYPKGLASALEKISKDTEPLEVANRATAHLYIVNPLKGHEGTSRNWFASLFLTHPPIEERIAILRAM